jgi:hypothetical protein
MKVRTMKVRTIVVAIGTAFPFAIARPAGTAKPISGRHARAGRNRPARAIRSGATRARPGQQNWKACKAMPTSDANSGSKDTTPGPAVPCIFIESDATSPS